MKKKPTYEELEKRVQELEHEFGTYKQTVEALQKREERFRSILDDISDLSIQGYDEERNVIFWNRASEKLYGYTANEALGNKFETLIIPSIMKKKVKDLHRKWITHGEKIPSGELNLINKSGNMIPVFSFHTMHEGLHGKEMFCIDIDLKLIKGTEEELLYKNNIITSSSSVIATCDLEGNMTYGNPSFLAAWGFDDPEEFLGRHFKDFWLVEEQLDEIMQVLQETGTWSGEIKAKRKDGIIFDAQISTATVFDSAGNPIALTSTSIDITENKRVLKELKESEERYKVLTNNTQAAVVVHSADTSVIDCNPKAYELLGLKQNQITGRTAFDPRWDFLNSKGNKMPIEQYPVNQVLTTQQQVRFQTIGILRPNKDDLLWVLVSADPLFDVKGKIQQVIVTFMDITARKQNEQALRQSESQLRQIIDLVPHFIFVKDETGKFEIVNKATAENFGTTVEDLTGRRDSEFVATEEELDHFRIDDLEVIKSGKTKFIPEEPITDSENNIRYLQTTKVPFKFSATKKPSLLGVAVDITERKQAEDALRESETKYRLLAESMNDVIVQLSPAGKLLYVSPNVKEFGGYDPESEIGNDISKYFVNDIDIIRAVELLDKTLVTHQSGSFEFLFKHKNKKPFYVEHTYLPILKNNKVMAIQLVLRDITERKESEAALKKASKEWILAMDAFDDIIYLLDNNRCVVQANSAFYKSMGVTFDKAIGRHIVEIIHPQGEEKPCPVCLAQEEKRDFVMIMEADAPNNPAKRPIEISVKIVRNEDGTPSGILMNLHDLTNARVGDETLRQYEHIISATNDHMSFLDRDYTYLAVNDAYLISHKKERSQIIGHTVTEILGDDVFEQFVKEKLDCCLAGEEIHYQNRFDFPGLGQRYMDVFYYPYSGPDGIISGVVVSSHDITERKLAEDMLHEKTMYLDNILRSSTEYAIVTTDLNFCITYYNPLAEKFFGYTAKEVIGKTVQEIHIKEDVSPKRFDKAIEVVRTQGEYCYKVEQETDKGIRYINKRISGIYDAIGELVGFALFSHDITTSIKAEQKLKYSKLQLEAVFNNLDSMIYITDMDSYEVIYMNEYSKNIFGKDFTGKICWKSFHENQDGPCDFCTNDKLIDTNGDPKKPYVWEFYNKTRNRWYEMHDQAIPWIDGRLVRMAIALDITERMQTQEKINASLKEKVILLREIHHRVKNNMQVIISLLRMHGRRTNDANLSKIFEDCRDRINAMSLIHESLYQSDNLAKIDFKVYLKKLCRNLGQAYGASGKGISLAVGECDVALDMDQGIAIGMVVAELISNAFKHAFPLGKGGNVSINLSELDAENVKLIIKDDGKGMPPEIDIMNSPSLGLRLAVSAVTLELGGRIEIDRDKGTQFTICFKYKRK